MNLKDHYNSLPRPREEFLETIMRECRVSKNTVFRWISGSVRPNPLAIKRISEITGIPESELFNSFNNKTNE